jgi:OFA family oxalate/formate antiporter-like MFS transporter
VAKFFGGLWLNHKGPKIVALTGGFLYGGGVFLASFSDHKLWWLYLTHGIIGGVGVGFSYIVPMAVLVKWFPERRGLITGVAVGGFGAGALITAPVATRLIQSVGVLSTFAYLGAAYLIVAVVSGYFMQNPTDGWKPEGWTATGTRAFQRSTRDYTLGGALRAWQWWTLWLLLFLNTSAGISVISQESPLLQELGHMSAVADASMVGLASIGNAFGRVFLARASDSITRRATFAVMFLLQVAVFWGLSNHQLPGHANNRRLHRAYVPRRRLWNHARLCGRLLWAEECRSHLRTHADCLGLHKRLWPIIDCVYAPGGWFVWLGPSCNRRRDRDFSGPSLDRVPAPPS